MAEVALAVDVGGTKLAACLVGPDGKVMSHEHTPTPRDDVWDALEALLVPGSDDPGYNPSKLLACLGSGRPVLGLMPEENLAAQLIAEAEGCVLEPTEEALDDAAVWVSSVLRSEARQRRLGLKARRLAEREFALDGCATRFEEVFTRVAPDATTLEVRAADRAVLESRDASSYRETRAS